MTFFWNCHLRFYMTNSTVFISTHLFYSFTNDASTITKFSTKNPNRTNFPHIFLIDMFFLFLIDLKSYFRGEMSNLSFMTIEDFKIGSVISIQISEFKNGPYIDGKDIKKMLNFI